MGESQEMDGIAMFSEQHVDKLFSQLRCEIKDAIEIIRQELTLLTEQVGFLQGQRRDQSTVQAEFGTFWKFDVPRDLQQGVDDVSQYSFNAGKSAEMAETSAFYSGTDQ